MCIYLSYVIIYMFIATSLRISILLSLHWWLLNSKWSHSAQIYKHDASEWLCFISRDIAYVQVFLWSIYVHNFCLVWAISFTTRKTVLKEMIIKTVVRNVKVFFYCPTICKHILAMILLKDLTWHHRALYKYKLYAWQLHIAYAL